MQRLFFLRAYGDFVIGLQQIAKSTRSFHIVASLHLQPLYEALYKAAIIPSLSIEFVDFGVTQGQFNFFTSKGLFHSDTLKQLNLIKKYIQLFPNTNGEDYVEQAIRLSAFNFLTRSTCKAVVGKNKNVYQAYHQFLNLEQEPTTLSANGTIERVLIFPDARQAKKEIPAVALQKLIQEQSLNGKKVAVARFNNTNSQELGYRNFEELIDLILSSDFIMSADSLPAHIAQAMNKPHSIFYNSKGVNRFCTPYFMQHKSFISINA